MSDLNHLIAAADRAQKQKEAKAPETKSRENLSHTPSMPKLPLIGGAVILVVILFFIIRPFVPVSDGVIRDELNRALEAAHLSVETYRQEHDRLPERVPETALSGMVQYELLDEGYRLSISMNGVTVTSER